MMQTIEEKLADRSMPEPNSGCLLWLRGCNHKGYGVLNTGRKALKAHRVAWVMKHGPIPAGMQICHKCDVRSCINPAHLFLGTPKENVRDCIAKNRASPPPLYKGVLTEQQVSEIFLSLQTLKQLAEIYPVSIAQIWRIKRGRAHVKITQHLTKPRTHQWKRSP